jgi:hypothetical protein
MGIRAPSSLMPTSGGTVSTTTTAARGDSTKQLAKRVRAPADYPQNSNSDSDLGTEANDY